MEPTLISVLAVKSLRKMELIGDHRQLPAFIQNCWFNLESSLPSIKTSLFERLISDITPHRKKHNAEV
jgi:superfamily I DNA and/or RNA helicase